MSKDIPCILNPDSNCPDNCLLHTLAHSVLNIVLSRSGRTHEQEIEVFRAPNINKPDFRAANAQDLKAMGIIDQCNFYPEAEVVIGNN